MPARRAEDPRRQRPRSPRPLRLETKSHPGARRLEGLLCRKARQCAESDAKGSDVLWRASSARWRRIPPVGPNPGTPSFTPRRSPQLRGPTATASLPERSALHDLSRRIITKTLLVYRNPELSPARATAGDSGTAGRRGRRSRRSSRPRTNGCGALIAKSPAEECIRRGRRAAGRTGPCPNRPSAIAPWPPRSSPGSRRQNSTRCSVGRTGSRRRA